MTVETGFGLTAQGYYYYGAGAQDLVPVPDAIMRRLMLFASAMNSYVDLTASPIASGQSVTMTVYPVSNGNNGLPPGAPAVTNGVWQTITFTLTGQMDYIGRDGSDYFNGFIWDVSAAGAGRFYALNDSLATNVIVNTGSAGSAANGVANNIDPPDMYTQTGTDWLGPELWTFGDYTFTGSENAFAVVIGDDNAVVQNAEYRYSTDYNIPQGSARFRIGDLITPTTDSTITGTFSGDEIGISVARMSWQAIAVPASGTISNTTVKRLLESAP